MSCEVSNVEVVLPRTVDLVAQESAPAVAIERGPRDCNPHHD